ncbi:MAG: DNA polymerase III subunit gamma/tau [Alphaproteobacteria bacterium]
MSTESSDRSYRVLARKYRPTAFAELIGQEALVRTLSNAIEGGRFAHAYLLTGVRGVGKTTTARILARALNCVGADGEGGPTVTPCGQCEHCVAITEDRHVDVLEMDAASRTKVEEMREVLDGVHYRPVSARYKVYIIDEVHMLSRHAFNALLKTLEEPPPHVKFVFATTEVRKVPVTVVSRCQRFDLRRVEAAVLLRHLEGIVTKEETKADRAALALIARAADGSVRDALSILDQAIAHCDGEIGEVEVRDMLGLADRTQVFDLFEAVMAGEIKAALDELGRQYRAGVDPLAVLNDLLDLTHWLTRVKLVPEAADAITVPEAERRRGRDLAQRLAMPQLARGWQMLLKGLGEARAAPDPLAATEMVLVRLAFVAELPAPAELVEALSHGGGEGTSTGAPVPPAPPASPAGAGDAPRSDRRAADATDGGGPAARTALAPEPPAETAEIPPRPTSLAEVVALADAKREPVLAANLRNHVRLVRFDPGRIEFRPTDDAPETLANDIRERLGDWSGERWVVVVSNDEEGAPTLAEQAEKARARRIAEAKDHPLVRAVLDTFPEAEVTDVRKRADTGPPPADAIDEEETS